MTKEPLVTELSTLSALRMRARLATAAPALSGPVFALASNVLASLDAGNKVLVFGNGGSAAIATHMAAELVGRFRHERAPLPAIALTTDLSAITAIANDYSFDEVFDRQVRALARAGDVVIGMSTSGRSPNVLVALRTATQLGARSVLLSGPSVPEQVEGIDDVLAVPYGDTAVVQEGHLAIAHVVCQLVEDAVAAGEPGAFSALRSTSDAPDAKLQSLDALRTLRARWRDDGTRVGWVNGCFDVVHAGHVALLRHARVLADVLVVGLNADASVRALKGPSRPRHAFGHRAQVLGAFEAVDWIVALDDATPVGVLEVLRPDVVVKGADYADGHKPMPERETIDAYGGVVEYVPLVEGLSTTAVLGEGTR